MTLVVSGGSVGLVWLVLVSAVAAGALLASLAVAGLEWLGARGGAPSSDDDPARRLAS